MGFVFSDYNNLALEKVREKEPIYNNAAARYNVRIIPVELEPEDDKYWRVIAVHHLSGPENRGLHHIYVDVLDEDGKRVMGARVKATAPGQPLIFATVDKPPNEPGTNMPMWKMTTYTLQVDDVNGENLPGEVLTGITSTHPDEEVGNTLFHHSFYVVFQLTPVTEQVTPPHPGSETIIGLEEKIKLVGEPQIIPLNKDAAFWKYARDKGLGERLSREYAVEHGGRQYAAQIYEKGVVYALEGDWDDIKHIPRVN